MNLISREGLLRRLRRGPKDRSTFVESHIKKGIAYQIRAIRDSLGWSQERLAREVGMPQNAVSRLESPDYGKPTLTTLRRLAAAYDVGLVVRFVPFSELTDWVSGTPRLNGGLNPTALAVPSFDEEEKCGALTAPVPQIWTVSTATGSNNTICVETTQPASLFTHVGMAAVPKKPASSQSGSFVVRQGNTNNGELSYGR